MKRGGQLDGQRPRAAGGQQGGGWTAGDFNGDGKDDIFRTNPATGVEMYLSDGTFFNRDGTWTTEGLFAGEGEWLVGDFKADGRDDIARYHEGVSGAEVLLSNGASFDAPISWTSAGLGVSEALHRHVRKP
jgi:hypothetical protein